MADEAVIQRRIQKLVRDRGGYAVKIHGDPMQPATVDLLVCYQGHFIGIETKVPGEDATPRQQHELNRIKKAGGVGLVLTGAKKFATMLDEYEVIAATTKRRIDALFENHQDRTDTYLVMKKRVAWAQDTIKKYMGILDEETVLDIVSEIGLFPCISYGPTGGLAVNMTDVQLCAFAGAIASVGEVRDPDRR